MLALIDGEGVGGPIRRTRLLKMEQRVTPMLVTNQALSSCPAAWKGILSRFFLYFGNRLANADTIPLMIKEIKEEGVCGVLDALDEGSRRHSEEI
jgi:hypothetical protein